MPVTSQTREPIPIQSDTSLPSLISPEQSLPAETSTCSKEDASFYLCHRNESVSGGELRTTNLKSYSPLCISQNSPIKELGLDRVPIKSPWKKKLDNRIQTRESMVCKLR